MSEQPEALGRVIIFAGPHGAGKDTLEARFRELQPDTARIVRHITRPPAAGETDGEDYHFVDDALFDTMVERGEFIEHASYIGCQSGTSAQEVIDKTSVSEFATLTANFEDGLTLHRRLGAQAVATTCLFISPCPVEVMRDDPEQYLSLLRDRMLDRGRPSDLVEGRLTKALQYRDLYLANEAEVAYVDNSNGQLEEASTAIARLAIENATS